MQVTFGGCALYVDDLTASRRFYEQMLGQKVLLDNGPHLAFEGGFAIWQADDAHELALESRRETKGPMGSANCELYFETDQVDRLARDLAEAGVDLRTPPREREWGQRVFSLADPDGHLVEIGEPADLVVDRLAGRGLSATAIAAKSRLPLSVVQAFLAASGRLPPAA